MSDLVKIIQGNCLNVLPRLPAASVQCCITSPPYWGQRDYGTAVWEGGDPECDHKAANNHQKQGATSQRVGRSNVEQQRNDNFRRECHSCGATRIDEQVGLEDSPEVYVQTMVEVFRGVRRVLRDDGTVWLNLGDKYSSSPTKGRSGTGKNSAYLGGIDETAQTRGNGSGLAEKNLLGIPWRVALALQADGWVLRSDIIWHRVNAMPGSQLDRPSCNHEYIFLLAKQPNYFYDHFAIRERAAQPLGAMRLTGQGKRGVLQSLDSSTLGTNQGDEYRTKRTVWPVSVASEKSAHFAAFPPRLILPCILAGTSEYGACAKCGTPYTRVVERRRVATRPGLETKVTGDSSVDGNRDPERHITRMTHKGWAAGCGCNAGVVLCVVLDPFAGTFTTCAVAAKKGRRAIGIELNEEYCEIGKRKIAKHAAQRGFGL